MLHCFINTSRYVSETEYAYMRGEAAIRDVWYLALSDQGECILAQSVSPVRGVTGNMD